MGITIDSVWTTMRGENVTKVVDRMTLLLQLSAFVLQNTTIRAKRDWYTGTANCDKRGWITD